MVKIEDYIQTWAWKQGNTPVRNSVPQHQDELDTGKELDLKTQTTDNINNTKTAEQHNDVSSGTLLPNRY